MLNGIKADDPELKILYFDESFFRSETPLTHTWGDKTDRKKVKASGHQGTIGVIGAVDPVTGEHEELILNGVDMDGEVVNRFIWQLAKRFINERILLVGDNVSYHKTQGSGKYSLPENISMIFLPPYSPDMNPQENVWKISKECGFKNVLCKNTEELYQKVSRLFSSLKNRKFLLGVSLEIIEKGDVCADSVQTFCDIFVSAVDRIDIA